MHNSTFSSFFYKLLVTLSIVASALAGTPVQPAYAATLTVNSTADATNNLDGVCTLREAIVNANADLNTWTNCGAGTGNDTITFNIPGASPTITLASALPSLTDVDGLTIDGTNLNASGGTVNISGNNAVRIFFVSTGIPATFQHLTLSNGFFAGNAGAINNNTGSITVDRVTFQNNSATTSGGAIYIATGGTATISNSTFVNNTSGSGGAIYHSSATLLSITNSTFTGNSILNTNAGGDGGAIFVNNTSASTVISDSIFISNSAQDDGGAIINYGASLIVTNSTFQSNSAGAAGAGATSSADGGAIRNATASASSKVTLSSFINNTISMPVNYAVHGGAISNSGSITIANVTFSGNAITQTAAGATDAQGGAVYAGTSTTVHNSTFSGNSASENGSGTASGGSIYSSAGVLTIANSIVAGGTENGAAGNCGGTVVNGGNNVVFGGNDCGFGITANPALGALTGSPAYFPLGAGSSALDAGDNTICANASTTNNQSQNGVNRPQNGTCDIGSYEASNAAPTDILLSNSSIAENNAINAVIGALSAVDASPGDTFVFSLSCSAPGGDEGAFNISGTDLRASAVFDYETKNSYAICIRVTDQGGAGSSFDKNFTISILDVDEVPPDTTITGTPLNPTNSTTASFAFTGTDNVGGSGVASFQCSLDGSLFAACTSPQPYTGLSDGSHNFQVRAMDVAGNVDPSPASFSWVVDTTAPDTTITANPTNPSSSTSASFSFTGNDGSGTGVASFECSLDGGGFAACTSPQSYTGLAGGSHTFQVRAIDSVGNIDPTPASYTWIVDTTAPDTTITSTPTDPSNSTSASFSFSGVNAVSFECSLDGGGFIACTSPQTYTGLSDGFHTFQVRSVDSTSKVDPSPASFSWTIDTTAPTVTINQAAGQSDPTSNSPIDFTVVFSEPVNGFTSADVDLSASTAGGTLVASISGTGPTYTVSVSSMTTGGDVIAKILAGTVTDAAGNSNAASTSTDNSVTFDNTLPDTVIDSSPSNPSNSTSATFTFSSPASDLAGFECKLDAGAFAACTTPQNYTGLSLGSHTFQVRAVDTVGNVDPTPASYTWMIDLGFPTVSNSTPANNATVAPGLTQLKITFSEDVKNDGSAGAANNKANYLLVEAGANNTFNTVSCAGGVVVDDTQIPIVSATYTNNGGSGPFVATLTVPALSVGTYRLFVCGTTSIEDLSSNKLNNGTSDATITFTVAPSASGGNNRGRRSLPATGFAMNQVTVLPAQPAEKAYASTDLWLEIPALGVKMAIVGVPSKDGDWDVKWLDKNAGWLNGSAFPTWSGNSVITGHVWDALNRPGPFADLKKLKYGDQIRIHAFGQVYIYEVRTSESILPTDTSNVFKHEEKSWVTLVTCEDYKELSQTYASRRMVRAVLVSVTAEK